MESKSFELKNMTCKEGIIRAILSTPDVDSYNDITLPSAISTEQLCGTEVKVDHRPNQTVGYATKAYREGEDTIVELELSEKSKYYKKTVKKIENGEFKGLSFGYYVTKSRMEGDKRILEEIEIEEITLSRAPANKQAKILSFKSLNSFDNIPIAPLDTPFDRSKADMNIRRFLNAVDAPNEEYTKCFLWFDKYAMEKFSSYKYQILDVVDGQLQIVPRAVKVALNGNEFFADDNSSGRYEILRMLDAKIEERRVEKKHELKSSLQKATTTNQIMKLWRDADSMEMKSNDMRESIFEAIQKTQAISLKSQENKDKTAELPVDLQDNNAQDTKNPCPQSGTHVEGDKPETDLLQSKSTPQSEGVSKVSTETQTRLDKESVKKIMFKNIGYGN